MNLEPLPLFIILLFLSIKVNAQNSSSDTVTAKKKYTTTALAGSLITLDGIPSEDAWNKVTNTIQNIIR